MLVEAGDWLVTVEMETGCQQLLSDVGPWSRAGGCCWSLLESASSRWWASGAVSAVMEAATLLSSHSHCQPTLTGGSLLSSPSTSIHASTWFLKCINTVLRQQNVLTKTLEIILNIELLGRDRHWTDCCLYLCLCVTVVFNIMSFFTLQ